LWGDGSPRREFLYNEDLAEALIYLMETKNASEIGEIINIGTGIDISIKELADLVIEIIYRDTSERQCIIEWDTSKPNGTPQKLLDISRLSSMGWNAKTNLYDGIINTYNSFLKQSL